MQYLSKAMFILNMIFQNVFFMKITIIHLKLLLK